MKISNFINLLRRVNCFVVGAALFLCSLSFMMAALPPPETTVYLTGVVVSVTPPVLEIHFEPESLPTNFTIAEHRIYRMEEDSRTWGPPIATKVPGVYYHQDSTIEKGKVYEYKVERDILLNGVPFLDELGSGSNIGRMSGTVERNPEHSKGKIITLVDQRVATEIASELRQFESSLSSDGWTVLHHEVETGPVLRHHEVETEPVEIYDEWDAPPTRRLIMEFTLRRTKLQCFALDPSSKVFTKLTAKMLRVSF